MGIGLPVALILLAIGFHFGIPYQQGHVVVWRRTQSTKIMTLVWLAAAILVVWIDYRYSA